MFSKIYRGFMPALLVLLIASLACNAPTVAPQTNSSAIDPTATTSGQLAQVPPEVLMTETPAVSLINHIITPPDKSAAGAYNYDVDSSGTGPEHRAPYGDLYKINLFERPFTQSVMDYHPELDIVTFRLSADDNFYYISTEMTAGDMNSSIGVDYGVELDTDHDGFGDYLIWAHPPYTPTWTTDIVQVYRDTNHDTGGASAEQSDAVFQGDGYDTIIFDQGQGTDADLAWIRLDPQIASAIQFAFKRSLAGGSFMWGVWADAGLKSPTQFNYNDRFKEEDAGSPEKNEKYYPIKAIYQVDNTCWAAFGFKPNGYEPHLCPPLGPEPTRRPKEAPTPFILLFDPCVILPEICLPPPPIIK